MSKEITTVEDYIAQYTPEVQERLKTMYELIKKYAPDASWKISWGMPTSVYHGNLVHFAANQHHIGFYPGESGVAHFQNVLAEYKTSKGAIQFPYRDALPLDLIIEIVTFRVQENKEQFKHKQAKK